MRALDKTKIYDLSELTSEERKELYEHLCNLHEELKLISVDEYDILEYKTYNKWCYWHKENSIKYKYTIHNAKELFYTLENVQVDCRGLSEEQVREMLGIFENKGYRIWKGKERLSVSGNNYLLGTAGQTFFLTISSKYNHTITYVKFMELFGSKSEQNVEVSKEFCKLLTEEISRQPTQEEIASIFSSREKESEKRDLKLKKTLKYLLKKDIILTPKQYKKLWKKS